MEPVFKEIKDAYLPEAFQWEMIPFGSGLINSTWKVQSADTSEQYILQKINTTIFKQPEKIDQNLQQTGKYLAQKEPEYHFVQPLPTKEGLTLFVSKTGTFRLQPFVKNTYTVDVVPNTSIAFEAARQFGLFNRVLHGFDVNLLQITLPDFHNLSLRYNQFQQALVRATKSRIDVCRKEIRTLIQNEPIVATYQRIILDKNMPLRVVHHDTKISNVLFNPAGKGVCVIDLDTIMPGYFISDVGDMCRTYLCASDENDTRLQQVEVREAYFTALAKGYLSAMKNLLTEREKALFTYSGQFMIYMQALRFLTDHLLGNPYYLVNHPLHNLERTQNQLKLLKSYQQKESHFQMIVEDILTEEKIG